MRCWTALVLPFLLVLASCDRSPGAPASPASADRAKDPVCGMMVTRAAAIKRTHDGADYYFCSEDCVKKFDAKPAMFAVHCTCANMKRQCSCDHCGGKDPCDCVK